MSDDLPEGPFDKVRRIDLQPGDFFVLTLQHHASEEWLDHLQEQWRTVAAGTRLLVLGPGAELTAYRNAKPAETSTAALSWHYGPTDWDPDPGKRWHTDCPKAPGEVWGFEEGDICRACGADDEPPGEQR